MDQNHYWAIAEADIEIQNPVTDRKLRLLDDYCDIRDGLKVLDIGCGKAWLMRQWASRYAIHGTGLEINPHFLSVAKTDHGGPGWLDFIEGPATDFVPEPASYDVVMCLGASFALGGFPQTLDWMAAAAKPGAAIVIGELTLKHAPAFKDYSFPQGAMEQISIMQRHGTEISALISASDADFERYVSHHRHSTLIWARSHADHPDHVDVLKKSNEDWTYYLRKVRPHLGWTIFVGRNKD